jgi:hypothetical protein
MSAGAQTKLIFCVVRRLIIRRGAVMNDITQGETEDVGLSECLCLYIIDASHASYVMSKGVLTELTSVYFDIFMAVKSRIAVLQEAARRMANHDMLPEHSTPQSPGNVAYSFKPASVRTDARQKVVMFATLIYTVFQRSRFRN